MCSVIAYTYDACVICPDCAIERNLTKPDAVDSEGNPVGAVFSTDEEPADGIQCDACGVSIVDPVEVDAELFFDGYAECALWASTDMSEPDSDECLDEWAGVSDIDDDSQRRMLADCTAFIRDNLSDLRLAVQGGRDEESLGHDFFLSRNGHGAGFFDRGRDPHWSRLQDASDPWGETMFESYLDANGNKWVRML